MILIRIVFCDFLCASRVRGCLIYCRFVFMVGSIMVDRVCGLRLGAWTGSGSDDVLLGGS